MKYITFLFIALLCGCSTVTSSLNYSKGTKELEAHDFEAAIKHLEEAVRLDPNFSRNHNNLASAYLGAGRLPEGWVHVRKATLLDRRNKYAWANCRYIFTEMRDATGLKQGDSDSTVREKLGSPDKIENISNKGLDCALWQYGCVGLNMVDGKLDTIKDIWEYR
jgi:tetratricopeptide (TPR) repeat protein